VTASADSVCTSRRFCSKVSAHLPRRLIGPALANQVQPHVCSRRLLCRSVLLDCRLRWGLPIRAGFLGRPACACGHPELGGACPLRRRPFRVRAVMRRRPHARGGARARAPRVLPPAELRKRREGGAVVNRDEVGGDPPPARRQRRGVLVGVWARATGSLPATRLPTTSGRQRKPVALTPVDHPGACTGRGTTRRGGRWCRGGRRRRARARSGNCGSAAHPHDETRYSQSGVAANRPRTRARRDRGPPCSAASRRRATAKQSRVGAAAKRGFPSRVREADWHAISPAERRGNRPFQAPGYPPQPVEGKGLRAFAYQIMLKIARVVSCGASNSLVLT
jgi:hypothetical protein